MAPRRRAERFGVALVVAFLVYSPLLCSAWSDKREFVEQQGNSSFLCKSSGPCIACSRPEKEADKFHCRTTGYHQSFKCLEIKSIEKTEENKRDAKHLNGDRTSSQGRGTIDAGEGRNLGEIPAFKIEGGLKTYLTFKSCTPAELRMDKFTVLQFEAIALASFALCSPLVYYRRKHSFSGMTRIPTSNPRF